MYMGRGTAGEVTGPYVTDVPSVPTDAETCENPAPPRPPAPRFPGQRMMLMHFSSCWVIRGRS